MYVVNKHFLKTDLIIFLILLETHHTLDIFSLYTKYQIVNKHVNYLPLIK